MEVCRHPQGSTRQPSKCFVIKYSVGPFELLRPFGRREEFELLRAPSAVEKKRYRGMRMPFKMVFSS